MSLDHSVCLKMGGASAPERAVDTSIERLPEEILLEILSRMSLKEAGRTSVLSHRWRYLWCTSRSLCFDPIPIFNDDAMDDGTVSEKFRAWVNRVLELHQAPQLDKFLVRFHRLEADVRTDEVDRWVDFAMRKKVKELEFAVAWKEDRCYEFPNMEKSALGSLRSLRLQDVDVKDEVVHNILASCPYLEALAVQNSHCTRNLRVLDPLPNLKRLEIIFCKSIQTLEVSATSLVSFKYNGHQTDRPQLKNIPNLLEVSLGGGYASAFIYEGRGYSSYAAQLVEIELRILHKKAYSLALPRLDSLKRVELFIVSQVGESLLFFASLAKAAPLLCQFKINICYILDPLEFLVLELFEHCSFFPRQNTMHALSSYPEACAAGSTAFYHENLKSVEMRGYIGCPSEDRFLKQLCKMAPSLEKVVIDTNSILFLVEPVPYHEEVKEAGASTRAEAMERAKNLKLGDGSNMIVSSAERKVIWQVET